MTALELFTWLAIAVLVGGSTAIFVWFLWEVWRGRKGRRPPPAS